VGFELRASHLQSRHSATWAAPLIPFLLWLFSKWGLMNSLPGWPQTSILPNSVSQIARITVVSHWHLPHPIFFSTPSQAFQSRIYLNKKCAMPRCLTNAALGQVNKCFLPPNNCSLFGVGHCGLNPGPCMLRSVSIIEVHSQPPATAVKPLCRGIAEMPPVGQ
jgi:hypothetical protein